MKKIFLSVVFAGFGLLAFSQDYSKVALLNQTKKYEDAKKEVDALATNKKSADKAETFYWISTVYGSLYADNALSSKYPEALDVSYKAYAKYKELEPDLKIMKQYGASPVASLYAKSFDNGKTFFQGSKWDSAFKYFKVAEEMGDFINKNGFSANKSAIDTFTVLYTGYAAQNAGKMGDAVGYYEKLAALKIGGKDFMDMYRYMLDYYSNNKQTDKFTATLAQAKELYPDQAAVWNQVEMGNMSSSSSLTQIMDKYKKESGEGKLTTADQYLGYADMLATTDKEQLKSLDSAQQIEIKQLAADAFSKAFEKDANGVYAYNAGVMYYSQFNTLDEKFYDYKGEGADLKAKRDAILAQQVPLADKSIEWLEKSYEILKAKTERSKTEATCLNRSVDNLANLYGWKRDRARGRDVKAYDQYDAKFTKFDAEHDKYKQ
ncbi:hypothetical protein QTN47_11120 [Danxiaibacter flavus]|uniref:Tetratricopeptide repeat protein n=1 Tax=Danxiaibacter flavus TaxID=3049108 RepID=A0ABV3ZFS8_9BACT|nr:hypothetical protein QNM32_11125 [Chitinophagaceae bacterium DXS]